MYPQVESQFLPVTNFNLIFIDYGYTLVFVTFEKQFTLIN